MKTLQQRIEQAAGISAATCANEGSPARQHRPQGHINKEEVCI